MWTAAFSCPLTNERFEALDLASPEDPAVTIDGRYHYTRKKAAIKAAAAHCMQGKDLRVKLSTNTTPEEDEEEDIVKLSIPNASSSSPSPFKGVLEPPRYQLQSMYRKYRIYPTRDCIRVTHIPIIGYTAFFECPITGLKYDAIDLPQVAADFKTEHGGRVWYVEKRNAINAASVHAMESINWKEIGKHVECRETQVLGRSTADTSNNDLPAIPQLLSLWYKQEHDLDIDAAVAVVYNFVITKTDFSDKGDR
jgi:hypothetical protein